MNQIDQKARSSHKGAQPIIRQSSLAGAVRTALFASGMALLASGSVYAQSCGTAAAAPCSTTQGNALNAPAQDLTVVVDAALPSAVSSLATAADSAAITPAAASTVRIVNRNPITKKKAGDVVGIYAALDDAIVTVVNDSSVDVTSSEGGLADGIFSAGAKTNVTNNGSISANGYSWVAGIENQSSDSAVIRNNGDIFAGHSVTENPNTIYSHIYGVFSKNFGDGGTVVSNGGAIKVDGAAYSTGIFAYDGGTGGIRLTNAGDISVLASADDADTPENEKTSAISTGIFASTNAPGSNIVLNNTGSVEASSKYRGATGIAVSAYGDGSKATVTNSGKITAEGLRPGLMAKYAGTALNVLAGGDIAITNSAAGEIYGKGEGGASGVQANSTNGNVRITNAGLINATAGKYATAGVIANADNGRVDFTNSGTLIAETNGVAVGARINGTTGAAATNSGQIQMAKEGSTNIGATTGLFVTSSQGDASARNTATGVINITAGQDALGSTPALATALRAEAEVGNATVSNAGAINVSAPEGAGEATLFGARASAGGSGNASASNTGSIKVSGSDLTSLGIYKDKGGIDGVVAVGLSVLSDAGSAKASNQGALTIDIPVTEDDAIPYGATGVLGSSTSGAVTLGNSGSIAINAASPVPLSAEAGHALVGLDGSSGTGAVSVTNTGTIKLDGTITTGARGAGNGGNVSVRNDGTIASNSTSGQAAGLEGSITGGTLTLRNGGSIAAAAQDGDAIGLLGTVDDGTVKVINSGNLTASSVNGEAYGVLIRGNSAASVDNTGSIVAATAIQGGDGATTVTNRGSLFGDVRTGAGNDVITNAVGGLWNAAGGSADFGAGDDSFRNQGSLLLSGSQLAFGAGNNSFSNTGTVKIAGNNTVQLGGGSAALFTNTGVLDFVNGKVGDSLTIAGNFAGKGNINMDVNLRANRGDSLYISGTTAAGTQQKLNVALLDGLPTSSSVNKPLQLVQVAGSADPKAFVAGQVLGISPADFLKLDMSVAVAKEPSGNGGNYLLAITPKVSGLNASGTLATAAALGVDSLLASTTGSWRDRNAMIESSAALPGLKGVTPWVRGFRDTGGMSPSYLAGNFGQGHSASLNQDNMGSEVGFNVDAGNGFSMGATVAKSEAKQYLAEGYGMDTLRGSSVGLYATWRSQGGAYVDASVRGMQFDAYMDTVAGRQQSQGNAHMLNLEAGHTWTLRNGLNLEPQFQYTSTTVSGMNVQGHQASLETETTNWQRGRVGLSLWKAYRGVSGWNVTPFGQINAVHTLDGTLDYNINRDFRGQLSSEGTTAMFKLGVNAAKGRFSLGSALNWQSGNLLDSGLGVQTRLSYAW